MKENKEFFQFDVKSLEEIKDLYLQEKSNPFQENPYEEGLSLDVCFYKRKYVFFRHFVKF